jgi:hypothetical protein
MYHGRNIGETWDSIGSIYRDYVEFTEEELGMSQRLRGCGSIIEMWTELGRIGLLDKKRAILLEGD